MTVRVGTFVLAALLGMVFMVAAADGAARNDVYPLRIGDAGPRVCDAQWLLMGRRPSVYRGRRYVKLRPGKPSCYFGRRTRTATVRMKAELGFPTSQLNGVFTRDVYLILRGRKARPLSFIARAADRQAAEVEAARAKLDTYASRIVRIAAGEVGCREIGWNYAPCITKFQAVTGAYRAPWCVSFAQWVYVRAGLGTFANRSAGVFYVRDYARARGWLRTVPKPGFLVAFGDRLGHMGIVERVGRGYYVTVEGNASDQVLRRTHPLVSPRPQIYIEVPGVLSSPVPASKR